MRATLAAVVFDLDGTLVDTAADLHLVLQEVLASEGLETPALPAVRSMVGDGAKVLVERALAATGRDAEPALVDWLHSRFRARYAEEPCRASALYPGAVAVLQRLAMSGLRLGLCTNKPQQATLGLLAALGIGRYFAAVVGGDLLPARKPDPAHLAAVLAALDVPPAAALMVGDSRNDVLTARGLDMACVLVSFGYSTVAARELGADAVIDRLTDLPDVLAGLTGSRPVPS